MFKSSAKELKNLRTVTVVALLVALHTVLSMLSINISTSLRVSVSFTANCIAGLFFGPVVGLICGGLGDIVGYLVKPTGPFFPGWTLNAALASLAYGIAFYKKYPKMIVDKDNSKNRVINLHKDNKDNKDNIIRNCNSSDRKNICYFIAQIAVQLGILVWLFIPFMSLKDLNPDVDANAMIFENNSIFTILSKYSSSINNTIHVLLIVIIIVFFILIYANTIKNKLIPAQIALYTACIVALALYEYRKKAVVPEIGFYIIIALLLIITMLNLFIVISQKSFDIQYLFRCFIVMLFVAVIVNGFLGTYWCTIMYGNKFMIYFIPRIVKNLIQLPINTMLAYVVIREVKRSNLNRYLLDTMRS